MYLILGVIGIIIVLYLLLSKMTYGFLVVMDVEHYLLYLLSQ